MLPTAGRYVDGSAMGPRLGRGADTPPTPSEHRSRQPQQSGCPPRDPERVRMTFVRMADRRPVETVVERDDGVVFRIRGAGGGPDLPHDLVHALVEQSLGVTDGIWGCVADGVVWNSMRHVSGRQPPHAAERSGRLKKERAARIQAAEHLADLV